MSGLRWPNCYLLAELLQTKQRDRPLRSECG